MSSAKPAKELLAALAINIFFIALCLIFGDLKYGAIDDYFMAAVLTGAHGTTYNPHLLFVNAIYGYLLIPLYKLAPTVGWYYIGEMASVFLSFTTICYIIIRKMGMRWGSLLATLFVALFASDFYLVLQFTQCASLLSAAGMLVFANAVTQQGGSAPANKVTPPALSEKFSINGILPFAYALFLLLWGSAMRWEAFLMGMPFFCVGLLFIIKQCWAKKFTVAISIAAMFALAFGMHHWDRSLYDTPEYRPYMQIQGPRAALGDGSNYNENAVYEDLEEMGKSGKDYHMLTNWVFYDTETFARDSMQAIVGVIDNYRDKNPRERIPQQLLGAFGHSLRAPLCWFWFAACLIILATNRRKFPYLWASLAVIFYLMTMLLASNRLVYRVESGFWLYAAILAIPLWAPLQVKKLEQLGVRFKKAAVSSEVPQSADACPAQFANRLLAVALAAIALANIFAYATSGTEVRDPSGGKVRTLAIEDSTDYGKVFAYIDSNPDVMFLMNMNSYMRFSHHKMPPYKAEPFGSYRNTISLGYWTPYLPEITQTLAEYGVTNPVKDVLHDNVQVVNEPGLGDFLLRHYYGRDSLGNATRDSIVVDTVRHFGEIDFFKYRLIKR